MPFFLLFFFIVGAFANTITIEDTFRNLNRICIYNKEGTTIKALLKVKKYRKICETLIDASGEIASKCDYKKVYIKADDLREKVVYYILNLWSSDPDLEYKLKIYGSDELWAGECPSDGLAKIANTSASNIAGGAFIGGVITALIFFGGIIYAFTPNKEDDDYHL